MTINGEPVDKETEAYANQGCCDNCENCDCCEGCGDEANPTVDLSTARTVLFLNIFMPGVGTLVAAYKSLDGFNCKACTAGVFQIVLIVAIVGIVWSIV